MSQVAKWDDGHFLAETSQFLVYKHSRERIIRAHNYRTVFGNTNQENWTTIFIVKSQKSGVSVKLSMMVGGTVHR